jgi:hypothetical protein
MRKIGAKPVPKYLFDVWEFLAQNNITILPHPPFSPGLAPCDFFLFPKFKTHLKGHHFGRVENVQAPATRSLYSNSIEDSFTAMKSGSNAGIAVFDHKGLILKGINCNCVHVE